MARAQPRQDGEEEGGGAGGPKGADEGPKHEEREKTVHREEMGGLDGEHRHGVEEGGKEGKLFVQRKAPSEQNAEPDEEEEGGDVGEGRKSPPQKVHAVVAVHVEEDGEGLGDRQGEGAVHEKIEALVVGVHGRSPGIEIFP